MGPELLEDEKSFLGCGMKFPPAVDSRTGRFELSDADDKVKESISLILNTYKGERLMLPLFGSELHNYVFASTDSTTRNLMAHSIKKSITWHEKRITDLDVSVTVDAQKSECLNININYVVTQSNLQGNMVFPFYIQEGMKENADEDK
ncbi:MAG: GPW/gp25 family protein [Oscillospiraceae bacterium]|nr:GPW/gp25 family protein [Oscillospiraceae bacterium]